MKTTFQTRYGHFDDNVMRFGLINAPTMSSMTSWTSLLYAIEMIFFNHFKNIEEHEEHVKLV